MKKDTSKSTVLIISMGFLIIYLIFSWNWSVYLSLIIGLTGAISSFLSEKIEWAWMKLARILSYIIPNILLGIIFYLFLFPLSLLAKLAKKDLLMLSSSYDSYFITVNKDLDSESFEKMW